MLHLPLDYRREKIKPFQSWRIHCGTQSVSFREHPATFETLRSKSRSPVTQYSLVGLLSRALLHFTGKPFPNPLPFHFALHTQRAAIAHKPMRKPYAGYTIGQRLF